MLKNTIKFLAVFAFGLLILDTSYEWVSARCVDIELAESPLIENFSEKETHTLGWVVNQEIIRIQDIPMLFVVYQDLEGVITEVVYMLRESHGRLFIEYSDSAKELSSSFLNEMVNISDSRLHLFTINASTNDVGAKTSEDYLEPDELLVMPFNNNYRRHFAERVAPGTNSNAILQSWIYHNFDVNLSFIGTMDARLSTRSGAIRGISLFGNTEHIALQEEITRFGTTLSFSFPWSVGASVSSNTQTWSSGTVRNATMVTRYRPAFSGTWVGTALRRDLVTIRSTADIATRSGNFVNIHSASNTMIFSTR